MAEQMKPSWADAPEWANWLAMDEDGEWYWFENEPYRSDNAWCTGGKWQLACYGVDWMESLERRPEA